MPTPRDLLAAAKAAITEVTDDQAEGLLGAATFLDVREPDEYEQGALPGAVHIPRGTLETSVEGRIPDKSSHVVVYCAGGTRSAFAAQTHAGAGLHRRGLGHRRVQPLEGRGPAVVDAAVPHARAAQPLPAPPAAARGRRGRPAEAPRLQGPAARGRGARIPGRPLPGRGRGGDPRASSTWTWSTPPTSSGRSSTTWTGSASGRSTRRRSR